MRLSDFITANCEFITDEWEAYAREIPAARGMARDQLRDHARQMLEVIARDLATPQTEQEEKEKSREQGPVQGHPDDGESPAEKHAVARARAGFSIEDVVSEFRALRASVLRLWGQSSRAAQHTDLDDMMRFNEAIDQAVTESVTRYAAAVKQSQDIFLAILGHDLRNPLGAVTMSAQFLMQDASLDSRHIKAATIIHNSSAQMSRLIDDLLDFTRTRLGQSMPISRVQSDLAPVVRQVVMQACAFHPDRTISFNAEGDLNGQWDGARIGQAFSNLVGNAIEHGSDREPVDVVLSGREHDVVATVHNGGSPIPENERPLIFEPLRRSSASPAGKHQASSLGLGLYITREIIRAHGGVLDVASSEKDGTTFTVRLPRQRRAA